MSYCQLRSRSQKKRLFLTLEYKSVAIWYWAERKRKIFPYNSHFSFQHQYNSECHLVMKLPRESFVSFLKRCSFSVFFSPLKAKRNLFSVIEWLISLRRCRQTLLSLIKINIKKIFLFWNDVSRQWNVFMSSRNTKILHCLTLISFARNFCNV